MRASYSIGSHTARDASKNTVTEGTETTMGRKHLDLGCGMQPRNPYGYPGLYGVDLHPPTATPACLTYKQANLALEPIPFADNTFDSVSAFDFVEHIPRQLCRDGQIILPFMSLMNEVWRTLKPGGLFYAVTPAYPHGDAFKDPTHVNIITAATHEYFCGDEAFGRLYGFRGDFKALRVEWVDQKNALTASRSFRKTLRALHRRLTRRGGLSHLLWELEAVKAFRTGIASSSPAQARGEASVAVDCLPCRLRDTGSVVDL